MPLRSNPISVPPFPKKDIGVLVDGLALLLLRLIHNPQDKVDNDGQQEDDGQESRTKSVVEPSLPPHSYRLCSPVVRYQSINHGQHGHAREEEGGDERHSVTKVEHADCQSAEDNGKVEP